MQDALALHNRRARGELSPHGLAVVRRRPEARCDRLLGWTPTDEDNRKLAAHLVRERDALFTFLYRSEEPATNWAAEQAIAVAIRTAIVTIYDQPEDVPLGRIADRQRRAVQEGRIIVEPTLAQALDVFGLPIAFLDFETVGLAIPAWEGCHPYDAVPVRFSCHVQAEDGRIAHHEWLAEGPEDSRPVLAEHLVTACEGARTVVAYNAGFERRCIEQMAEELPALGAPLRSINERLMGLLPVVRNHIYHPDFETAGLASRACCRPSCRSCATMTFPSLTEDGRMMSDKARHDLFVRLATYRPSAVRESREDFLTELMRELMSREPEALAAFLTLSKIPVGDAAAWTLDSQVPVRSATPAPMSGRLDLLLQRPEGPALIVESKLDAPVDERQLRGYLAYAEACERATKQPWRVALVTQKPSPAAIRNPRFVATLRWFQVADAFAAIHAPRYPYLLEGVLEFMREMGMGPIDPFEPAELISYRTWKSFERKVDALLARLETQLGAVRPPEGLQWSRMEYPSLSGKGVGWSWPTDRPVSQRSFWYYLGFAFDSTRWFIRLAVDCQPEAVVAIGLWGERTLAALVNLVNSVLESKGAGVSAAGFELVEADDGCAVVLLRRLPLVEVAHSSDQVERVREFFSESHRLLIDSGVVVALAAGFCERFAAAPTAARPAEDSPEAQLG